MKSFAFPGLEAKILDGDVALEEHEDDDSEQADESNVDGWRNASAYIEAVSGATFAIEYTTNANFEYKNHDICMTILLDGKTVVTKVYSPGHSKRVVPGVDEPQNGGYCLRRFTFADLTTSDGPATQPDIKPAWLKNLGEVSLEFVRARKVGETFHHSHGHGKAFEPNIGDSGISEKALKGRALSQRAVLGKSERGSRVNFVDVDYPWGKDPFLTFTFKYRSHRDLQISGILPRSPSPTPLEERDPDTLTAEEARELVRIQREQLQNRTKVKKEKREREDDDEEGDDDVTIVSQQRKRPRTSADSAIEVIDLT